MTNSFILVGKRWVYGGCLLGRDTMPYWIDLESGGRNPPIRVPPAGGDNMIPNRTLATGRCVVE